MPAFILATFGWWSVMTFVLDRILGLGIGGIIVVGIVCVVLEIVLPGTAPFIRALFSLVMKVLTWLIGTTAGAFVLVAAVCLAIGFAGGRLLDRSIELQRKLEAQVEATQAAEAAAAQARENALDLNKIGVAATQRAEAAEAKSADDEEQVSDYAEQLAAAEKAAPAAKPACSHALTAADVAALARIGAPRAAKH